MRIVNLEEFRAMPPWTVFRKYKPFIAGDLQFKFDTLEHDFTYMSVEFPENTGTESLFSRLEQMEHGASFPLESDGIGRDGLFDAGQMFLIYERDDLIKLQGFIDKAIATANPGLGPT